MPVQFPSITIINVIDILFVSFVLYKLIMLIKGTRAVQLLKGLAVLLAVQIISEWMELYTIHWILRNTMTMVFVALPVVFQPELRRALEQLGRGKFFARPLAVLGEEDMNRMINEIIKATGILAKNKIGALLVIERETGLKEIIETGIKIDGVVSAEFLVNIFVPHTPLHDGAVIVRGDRVVAASCFLPLTENPDLSKELGTRHRAGLGVSEHADAVAVIVSEETGIISLAHEGKLTRYLDEKTLKETLTDLLQPKTMGGTPFWTWRS